MYKIHISEAPQRIRGGLTSYILLQSGDISNSNLAITWVEILPESFQKPHSHPPEQTYIITKGFGKIYIGEESSEVKKGDMIYIPSNVIHYIENLSDKSLIYISASTPSYDFKLVYDEGDLKETE